MVLFEKVKKSNKITIFNNNNDILDEVKKILEEEE